MKEVNALKIEQQVFQRKCFVFYKLLEFGFVKKEKLYQWKTSFMNGNFTAIVTVDDNGHVVGKVFDEMNQEEYVAFRNKQFSGAFVNQVRNEYERLLKSIAHYCCEEFTFMSEQANRLTDWIINEFKIEPDFPWKDRNYQTAGTFRHVDTKKWFALIMNIKWGSLLKNSDNTMIDVINLKAVPEKGLQLQKEIGIFPGFHMNRHHWISVVLNDTHSDEFIFELIKESFYLTKK